MDITDFQTSQADHSRWRAVTKRDPAAHFSFLYGVKSTRIYCRPTCTARLPRRVNVIFYDSCEQALRDGYRPCQRCKPDDESFLGAREEIVIRALAFIKERHDDPTMKQNLQELSKDLRITPSYLCRAFKKTMGITIGQYLREFEKDDVNYNGIRNPSGTRDPYGLEMKSSVDTHNTPATSWKSASSENRTMPYGKWEPCMTGICTGSSTPSTSSSFSPPFQPLSGNMPTRSLTPVIMSALPAYETAVAPPLAPQTQASRKGFESFNDFELDFDFDEWFSREGSGFDYEIWDDMNFDARAHNDDGGGLSMDYTQNNAW